MLHITKNKKISEGYPNHAEKERSGELKKKYAPHIKGHYSPSIQMDSPVGQALNCE